MTSPTADDLLPYVSRIFMFDSQIAVYPCCSDIRCEECIACSCRADPSLCSILNLFYPTKDSQKDLDKRDAKLWYSFYEYTVELFPRSDYPEFYT